MARNRNLLRGLISMGKRKWTASEIDGLVIEPSGKVIMYAGSSTPTGYLLCDGSEVSRTTYADLFTAIGTTWGVGDGSTTFDLPDMRGRAPIAVGTGSGLTARALADEVGVETHPLVEGELPAHSHSLNLNTGTGAVSMSGNYPAALDSGGNPLGVATTNGTANAAAIADTGSGTAHQNMQPSVAVNFFIKT